MSKGPSYSLKQSSPQCVPSFWWATGIWLLLTLTYHSVEPVCRHHHSVPPQPQPLSLQIPAQAILLMLIVILKLKGPHLTLFHFSSVLQWFRLMRESDACPAGCSLTIALCELQCPGSPKPSKSLTDLPTRFWAMERNWMQTTRWVLGKKIFFCLFLLFHTPLPGFGAWCLDLLYIKH